MLRVTVELVPFGNESKKRVLSRMVIANDGSGTGGYDAWVTADQWTGQPEAYGRVDGHDRSLSVWNLISKLIKSILEERPEPDNMRLRQRLTL